MQTIKFVAASNTEILTFNDYSFWGNIWFWTYRVLIFLFHIAPIIILLFIAVVVWRIYKNGKKDKNEENLY